MGAGKTSVGALLARKTGMDFCDLDALVAERGGASIERLIESLGEGGFREMESAALEEICSSRKPVVVSTGGGVVVSERNRRSMERSGVVVYLKASLETLMRRISQDPPRPLLKTDNPEKTAGELLSARARFYETAHFTIETDGFTAEDVASKVEDFLRGL